MAKFSDLPQSAQLGIVAGIAIAITIGVYFMLVQPVESANVTDRATLEKKKGEIAQLEPYESKVADLDRQIQSLDQQLELQKRIVPDEKEVPGLITLVQAEASKSGVEIRRYTSKPVASKEFYSEAPFDIDVDGPYYAVLDFFQRLGQLERIVNVSNMAMASTKRANEAKVRRVYPYAPSETVVSNFTATTFFSTPKPAATATAPAATPAKK